MVKGEFRLLDVTDSHLVTRTIQETKPDVIVNAAAMTQVDQCENDRQVCWKANVTAVENLVNASRQNGVHLVHVSTDFIFDGTEELLDENAIPNPVNYYGESKLA